MAHESLKAAYEEDAKRTEKPYLLWQVMETGKWFDLSAHPIWVPSYYYRRHPHADNMLLAQAYPHLEWEYRQSSGYWQDCVCAPLWDQTAEYRPKPNPLQALYEADKSNYDLWQYKSGGAWRTCLQSPDFYSQVMYRRHPHADKMLAYNPHEKWEWRSNGVWRDCHHTPAWHHDLDYRKKIDPLQQQYEKDLLVNPQAYIAWQFKHDNTEWETCYKEPEWAAHNQYRRRTHADLILTYDPSTVYEFQAADKPWCPWQTVSNPPLWEDKLNYRKKPMTHETERKQYEADKATYNEPWRLWEFNHHGWATMQHEPCWYDRIQYRRKPEARPHAHLIKLWADGAEIQKLNHNNQWIPCPNPCWESTGKYRQKPAHQTRWIGIYRMPAASVYVGEGKISREDCVPSEGDTLIKLLEVTVHADNSTTVKEHLCD